MKKDRTASNNHHDLQTHHVELEMQNENLRRMQLELEESRNMYTDLYDFAPVGYFTFNKNGLIQEANLTGANKLGVERSLLIGIPFSHFVAQGSGDAFYLHLLSAFKKRTRQTCELKLVDKNGNQFDAQLESLLVQNGGPGLCRTAIIDITDRKRAQEDLKKVHDELETLVEKRTEELACMYREEKRAEEINRFQANILSQVNDAVIAVDNENRVIYWNNGAERLYDINNEEIVGRPLEESHHYLWPEPGDEKAAYESIEATGSWRGEHIHVKKSGEEISVDTSVSVLRNDSGERVGLLAIVRDITGRKKIEEALQKSEKKYRGLFESLKDGVGHANMEGRILECNQAYLDMLGYTMEEIRDLTYQQLTPPKWHELENGIVAQQITGRGYSDEYEKEYIKKDGTVIPVSLRVWLERDGQGEPVGMWGIARDITERKLAENALRESEEKYRSLFDNASDAIITFDLDDTVTSWNRSAERIFGWTAQEAAGKKLPDLIIPPDMLDDRKQIVSDAIAGKNIYGFETTRMRKDGSKVDVSLAISPIVNANGDIVGLSGILRDMTEHRRIEKERELLIKEILNKQKQTENLAFILKKERDTLNIIMENTETQLAYLDSKFNFIRVNSAYAIGSGYKKQALMGRNHFEIFPHPENQAIFEKVRDTGEAVGFKAKPFEFPDQPWRGITYWDWTLTPVKDAGGQLSRLVLSLTEVTERIRLEQTIRESLTYAESIVDTIQSPFLIMDSNLLVKKANHAFYKMFRVPIEETRNKSIYDLGNGQWNIPELRELLEEIIPQNSQVQDFEVEHEFPGIGVRTMLLNARRIYRDNIDKQMILLVIEDITEHKKMDELRIENERLISASKARSEFLSIMSHELRTPLTSIIGYSILLEEMMHGSLNEKQKSYVDSIHANSKHLLSLINSILDLAKLEAGKLEMFYEDVSLESTINELLDLMKEKAASCRIVLKKEFGTNLPIMKADRLKLKQILFNLLSNAIKFSKEDGGVVTISAKKKDGFMRISVSDTGIGIREDDIPRLFRKFEQLDSGVSRKYGGTGLGLAITKELVEMHGGNIWVESRYGEGSSFIFQIPVEPKKEDFQTTN